MSVSELELELELELKFTTREQRIVSFNPGTASSFSINEFAIINAPNPIPSLGGLIATMTRSMGS